MCIRDSLMLNKCDLVEEERLQTVEQQLREVKNDARILRSTQGDVPLPLLLSVGLFESDKVSTQDEHHDHDHDHSHSHSHSHHDHAHSHSDHLAVDGFTSLSFQSDGPFALRRFQNFLDNQLPAEVFRAKGILWFNESERRHVFHLAGKRFSIDDTDWTGERKNQLVLIGRDIDHDTLRQQLQACVDEEAAGTPSAGSSGNGLN